MGPVSPRVLEVEMLSTCDRGPGPPQVGPGPPRAYPDPCELSDQLAAWAGVRNRHVPLWARPPTPGSGAVTCPTGTSLLPEASPPAALNAGGWGVRC